MIIDYGLIFSEIVLNNIKSPKSLITDMMIFYFDDISMIIDYGLIFSEKVLYNVKSLKSTIIGTIYFDNVDDY